MSIDPANPTDATEAAAEITRLRAKSAAQYAEADRLLAAAMHAHDIGNAEHHARALAEAVMMGSLAGDKIRRAAELEERFGLTIPEPSDDASRLDILRGALAGVRKLAETNPDPILAGQVLGLEHALRIMTGEKSGV